MFMIASSVIFSLDNSKRSNVQSE